MERQRLLSQLRMDTMSNVGQSNTYKKQDMTHKIFRLIDKDKNGYIDSQELIDVFSLLGEELTYKDVIELISWGTGERKDYVTYSDFVNISKKTGISAILDL